MAKGMNGNTALVENADVRFYAGQYVAVIHPLTYHISPQILGRNYLNISEKRCELLLSWIVVFSFQLLTSHYSAPPLKETWASYNR